MKKIIFVIMSLFCFLSFNIFAEELNIKNVAVYSVDDGEEILSNGVFTQIKKGIVEFFAHTENESIQNLTKDNKTHVKTILNLTGKNEKEFYFKASYNNSVYPKKLKFYIVNLSTNETVLLPNSGENYFESQSYIFKGNSSYYIYVEFEDLKNTVNLESALFCLDLVSKENNAILGCIENKLLIKNNLKLFEHEDNEKEQNLDKEKGQKIIGNIYFDNILNEEMYFTLDLEKDIKFSNVNLYIDGKEVKIWYDLELKKYRSENLNLNNSLKVEVLLKNPEYIGDLEKGLIILEANYNNKKYGEIKNTINYKDDRKILIEKISQTKIASIGDLVKYEVVIKNSLNEKFEELIFTDYLPRGMAFIENSVKIPENFILEDVKINNGNKIDIKLMAKNSSRSVEDEKITYLVRVNSSAKDGKNINRVNVIGKNTLGQIFESNIATAEVKIDTDNFYDKGIVLGRVFLDIDGDNLFNEDVDINIPGVKIFLENGDFAISDRHGKYSIYGVEALTHIAKVQKKTLPLGLKTKKISNKYDESGNSRFVDLKKAQLARADFILTLDSTRDLDFVKKIVQKRFETLAQDSYELDRVIEDKFLEERKLGERIETSGEKGILNNGKEIDIEGIRHSVLYKNVFNNEAELEKKKSLSEEWNLIPDYRLEGELANFDNSLDFINVKDQDLVPEYMSFQVKGPGNGTLKLFQNDVEISPGNISLTAKVATTDVFFLEYSSIQLKPGKTKMRLSYHDMFGVERGRKEIEIFVRGKYEDIDIKVIDSPEDISLKKIVVRGVDNYGYSIDHTLTVNIEANKGRFITRDGVIENTATFVTNIDGYGEVGYKPSPGKNKVKFKLSADGKEKEIELEVIGEKDDFFVNGIIEGRYNFNNNKDMNFFFQKEIDSYNDKFFYRGAVYAEGDIDKVGYLTMTYDTYKDDEDKFFSYRNPEDYYPIFGDNSTKGYVGKSADNLYLRIDRDRSYILYGDYRTSELLNQRLRLGRFSRTLTGGVLKYEDDSFLITSFISKTSNVKYIEELPGEGVSGPYKLGRRDIIEGSERVSLVVYDKINGMVLEEQTLVAGEDYTLEYDFGRLYFSEPIPSMDLNFNPVKIKISYEVEDENGKKSLVYGGEGDYKINENLIVGTSYFKDDREMENQEIVNVHAVYESEEFILVAEHSFTTDELQEKGDAVSLYSKYENEKIKAELEYEKASSNYDNEDANVEKGVHRGKVELEYKLNDAGKLKMKSLLEERTLDSGDKEKKIDTYLGYETEWIQSFKFEAGGRQYLKESDTDLNKVYTIAGKITWEGLEEKKMRLFLEYEQGIEDASQKRLAIGADYKLFGKTSLYMRHEVLSSLGEFYYLDMEEETNRTLIGIKTTYSETEVYSEYREETDEDAILPEMGYGVKRKIEITENLEIFGTFERVSPLSENSDSETSLTLGYDYKSEKIGRLRGEFEIEIEDEFSFLNRLSYGKQLNDSTYFIAKNRYYKEGSEIENRFLVGLAYRDSKDNSYNSLNKYELNYSKNIVDEEYTKLTHIFRSSHNFQNSTNLEKTLTFGIKNSDVNYEGVDSNYISYLIAGNLSYDIFERFTTGVSLAAIFDNEKNIDYGVGVEVGYIFKNNLWLSLGYNFVGFKDKDFDPGGELNQGLFFRFRMNVGDVFDRIKSRSD
ncbi:MAG: DUF11 domain-containing protein [Cetobacterium sp.]